MKRIAILGSTGSIGQSAIDIIERFPDRFTVTALAARANVEKLAAQIERLGPEVVSVADGEKAEKLRSMTTRKLRILTGVEGAVELAGMDNSDLVVSAMVGAAGLAPTMAAVKAGKTVALANKEALVAAGALVMKEARKNRARIIPVDSEHSAVFQALRGERRKNIRRIILTASCGPFRDLPIDKMKDVTVQQALNHPTWDMGPKITIDSATMMNKGLEVIEARWLFNVPEDRIEVLAHPQSIVHSMVEFSDSSVIAQMGLPDMRAPIAFALSFPERLDAPLPSLDLSEIGKLTFERPDTAKFPSLALAYEALRMGGCAPAVLNAANEVAVEAFLAGRIRFTAIPLVVEKALRDCEQAPIASLADALHADQRARAKMRELIKRTLS
ncbi:MAG: 1-deoxy-D-xylulose-5-phosphate reductoisomerase [Candidatus Nitrospinota bacterium M3_3B_026]